MTPRSRLKKPRRSRRREKTDLTLTAKPRPESRCTARVFLCGRGAWRVGTGCRASWTNTLPNPLKFVRRFGSGPFRRQTHGQIRSDLSGHLSMGFCTADPVPVVFAPPTAHKQKRCPRLRRAAFLSLYLLWISSNLSFSASLWSTAQSTAQSDSKRTTGSSSRSRTSIDVDVSVRSW